METHFEELFLKDKIIFLIWRIKGKNNTQIQRGGL